MLNCHDATRLMSESQERKLSLAERMELRVHQLICSGCRNCGRQLEWMRHVARSFAQDRHDPDR